MLYISFLPLYAAGSMLAAACWSTISRARQAQLSCISGVLQRLCARAQAPGLAWGVIMQLVLQARGVLTVVRELLGPQICALCQNRSRACWRRREAHCLRALDYGAAAPAKERAKALLREIRCLFWTPGVCAGRGCRALHPGACACWCCAAGGMHAKAQANPNLVHLLICVRLKKRPESAA